MAVKTSGYGSESVWRMEATIASPKRNAFAPIAADAAPSALIGGVVKMLVPPAAQGKRVAPEGQLVVVTAVVTKVGSVIMENVRSRCKLKCKTTTFPLASPPFRPLMMAQVGSGEGRLHRSIAMDHGWTSRWT